MLDINKIHHGDNIELLKLIDDKTIDLTVTSPPYDNLRNYKGYNFNYKCVIEELYRITKDGGVVVWIINDGTDKKGSKTGSSFEQALYFKECGFNIHDTMIWNKNCFSAVGALKNRYAPVFDYMFIFSKGKPKTFNPIKDKKNKWAGTKTHGTMRQSDGSTKNKKIQKKISEYGQRYNIWEINPQRQRGENKHPAPFPEDIANDHIISWSNEGDIVLDCFMGSGTTAKMAIKNNRNYIGMEISEEYIKIANERIKSEFL